MSKTSKIIVVMMLFLWTLVCLDHIHYNPIPSKADIIGAIYSIHFISHEDVVKNCLLYEGEIGATCTDTKIIIINKNLNHDDLRNTLYHELEHAYYTEYTVKHVCKHNDPSDVEEDVVNVLDGMWQVLKDNSSVSNWMNN